MGTDRTASSRRAIALAFTLGLALAGCTSDPGTLTEQRRDRVANRLEATFSRRQSSCIVDRLDATTLAALDKKTKLPADSKALERYSDAVATCMTDQSGS